MNKRIQELSSQARDYTREYVADCKQYGYYMEHNEYDLQFSEKFALLIVRECNSKLDNIGVIDRDSRTIAMKVISEHFGVES
jgi:hypothetical protein